MSGETDGRSILIIEDDPSNRRIIAKTLSPFYRVVMASDGSKGVLRAKKHRPSLILLDINLPDQSGFDVLKTLKKNEDTRDIPVLCLTAATTEKEEEKSLSLGAVDFIGKPIRPKIVLARIAIHIEIASQRKSLEKLTQQDPLTGVNNRRSFDKALNDETRRARRSHEPLSLIMVDVDHFKKFNDNYGHQKGDEALRLVATALAKEASRAGDLCARYGGEEFTILLPRTTIEAVQFIAENCRNAIASLAIPHAHSESAECVTASLGCATWQPSGEADAPVPNLVGLADKALYAAKEKGRNQIYPALHEA
ncbi:diguanylate cyclase [Candidatus Marimicrobium litorale]|uniref:diguanylate cyclase n=1 Tax=Candidatus Marimicrobium litorale TaxID=2518991 RepID=A0ABT3TB40_9GAMM|nr:diguanylate cyclase [Candidatus Marimicrobium litorale]MCX2979055.1 diguanylate cyclase [Candidatus Marimicrobium litorale]